MTVAPFHRGMRGYATLLADVRDNSASTTAEIAARVGLHGTQARTLMRLLHHHRLVHIGGWKSRRPGGHGASAALWRFGQGIDVLAPAAVNGGRPLSSRSTTSPRSNIEMLTFVDLWHALEAATAVPVLAEISGAGRASIHRLMKHMEALKLVYVGGWDSTLSRCPQPAFRLGQGSRAKRPTPKSNAQICLDYVARRKARDETLRFAHITAGRSPQPCAA